MPRRFASGRVPCTAGALPGHNAYDCMHARVGGYMGQFFRILRFVAMAAATIALGRRIVKDIRDRKREE